MRRSHRVLLVGGLVVSVVAAIFAAPRLLPALPGFEVRRVEVSGNHLLSAHEVLRTSGIRAGQSVWESVVQWEEALGTHPVIDSVRVSRRLPGTLRVIIQEKRPVAYLAAEVLALVTATGERLAVDPTRSAPDLPIARGKDDGAVPVGVLVEAERLTRIDPDLVAEVSEIRSRDDHGRVLLLRHREADIVLPAGAPADRLLELRAVLDDLDDRVDPAGGVARVDLRFADQIVVRVPSSVQKP